MRISYPWSISFAFQVKRGENNMSEDGDYFYLKCINSLWYKEKCALSCVWKPWYFQFILSPRECADQWLIVHACFHVVRKSVLLVQYQKKIWQTFMLKQSTSCALFFKKHIFPRHRSVTQAPLHHTYTHYDTQAKQSLFVCPRIQARRRYEFLPKLPYTTLKSDHSQT